MPNLSRFGDRLRVLIAEQNCNQREFSDKVGVTYANLSRILTWRDPAYSTIEKVSRVVTDKDLVWLIKGGAREGVAKGEPPPL
ncbi:MAG: hypothetical protein KDA17_05395 [Candidatus Saccharibacteria bacterium]|nr:hypothetical protein [Candidatus Saccharibacteria bacterium]